MNKKGSVEGTALGVFTLIILVSLVLGAMWGLPKYKIYRLDLAGQANLRQQEWEKQILVEQAKAETEAATLEAEAEVARAKGVAEANEIIGDSLRGNEVYLKYLMVQTLEDQDTQLIYVPTEANLPILEANRN